MENFKEKYNKALEKAKELYSQHCAEWRDEDIEYIFPELKESEDEKIRKELLEHCKNQAKPYIQTGNECPQIQSWIDWLERQGKKEPISFASGEDGKIMNLIFSIIQNTSAHSEYFASDIKKEDCIEWLNSLRLRLTDGEE